MRVIVYPSDDYACGHYRMIWPAEELAAQGMDVQIVPPGVSSGIRALSIGGVNHGVTVPECDAIVVQRPARGFLADLVPLIRAKGIAVIIDMDDDLERIHPANPAFRAMHPKHSPNYNWAHARRACKAATMVTVSTPALLPRYASHGRARLIPNYVPRYLTEIAHDPCEASVGWAGSLHSHPDDLDQAAHALGLLFAQGHELRFVGPSDGLERKLGVELREGAYTGELPFEEWLPAVSRLGVGIAPLADTSFNTAKSWLKPLEYCAAGVPWVASDTPEYRRLAKMCGAELATKPKQWYSALKRLLVDEDRRVEASEAVRAVARKLTIETHAHLWAEAWQEAVRTEKTAAKAKVR